MVQTRSLATRCLAPSSRRTSRARTSGRARARAAGGRGGADGRRGRRGRVRGRMGRGRRRRRRRRRRLGRGRHRRPRRLPRGRGMGRRLGRRCPRGHRRLGLRPRGRTAGHVRMGRVRPARRSRREPHRVRRGPERSLGQGKSHPPNQRRATRSLIVSARVGAPLGSSRMSPAPNPNTHPRPRPRDARTRGRRTGASARQPLGDDPPMKRRQRRTRGTRGTRASPRRRRNSPSRTSPSRTSPSRTSPSLPVSISDARRRVRRTASEAKSDGDRVGFRRRDARPGDARLAPRERSRASSAVTNAAAAAAASIAAPFTLRKTRRDGAGRRRGVV